MPSKKIFDIYPPKISKEQKIKAQAIKASESPKKEAFPFKKLILLSVFVIFVFGVIFFSVMARAEIEIRPKTESVFAEDDILVDTKASNPDFSKKVIPGFLFSEEKAISQEFTATGVSGKKGKASGVIRVYNNYHLSQSLVVTTRFISADGKLFRSKEGINVPAGEYVDVGVEAAESGPEYNIKPTKFSIPGLLGSPRYMVIYGESLSTMKGGLVGQVSQVTKEDLEKAKTVLYEKVTALLEEELKTTAGPAFLMSEEATKNDILESTCSRKEGEEVEKFECILRIRTKALAFSEITLKELGEKLILGQIQDSRTLKEGSLEIESTVKNANFETESLALKLKVKAEIFLKLDTNLLKEALKDKSLKESKILLESFSEIETTKLKVIPFWIQKIPQDSNRIEIKIDLEG